MKKLGVIILLVGAFMLLLLGAEKSIENEQKRINKLVEKLSIDNKCNIDYTKKDNGTIVYYCNDTQLRVYVEY